MALFAFPAMALNEWTDCTGSDSSSASVSGGQCKQFRFDDSGASTSFTVNAKTALVQFEQDALAASGVAEVMIQVCVSGYTASATTCDDILGATLTGAGGSDASQRRAVRVGPGLYRLVISTAAGSGDEAVVQVTGEN
jgi:hypothetical protein